MTKPAKTALPKGIFASDLAYPRVKYSDNGKPLNPEECLCYDLGDHGQLTFYETTGFGWCIATLGISNGKRGQAARTYATRVADGASVRVGNGPHVLQTITVYVRKGRVAALKPYLDLYQQGAVRANTIRDRISSRRAQGAEMRAQGRHSWRWDV